MQRTIAVVGGGIAGLAAAYELQRQRDAGQPVSFTLIEASNRLGGTVETIRDQGFVMECGPDGWVTEKPWARELALELGLEDELIVSNDATRITWVLRVGKLVPLPERMRLMVPEDLNAIAHSELFSASAKAWYAAEAGRADELRVRAPDHDESVADFVKRHFGDEVLRSVGAPLLGGVFGGNVFRLSVRAVMPQFVQMEREYGSLVRGLQARAAGLVNGQRPSVFTSLRSGTGILVERMSSRISADAVRMNTRLTAMQRIASGWLVTYATGEEERFDHVLLCTPVAQARQLLVPTDAAFHALLNIASSSAVIAAFGFGAETAPKLPGGFGFLVPEGEGCALLAATFADQKFACRVPVGGKSIRAYFGGSRADTLMEQSDEEVAELAIHELTKVLGPLPEARVTVVRRWANALPQYEVGHLERMQALEDTVSAVGALHLLGNGYRGVGLPDLIRDARASARVVATYDYRSRTRVREGCNAVIKL